MVSDALRKRDNFVLDDKDKFTYLTSLLSKVFTICLHKVNCTVLLLTGRVVTPGCPEGWQRSPDGSRCFGLLFDHKNWQDARQACKVYGADLASFHSRYG